MKYVLILICAILFMGMQSSRTKVLKTEHFRLKYDKRIPDREAEAAGKVLESGLAKITARLKRPPRRSVDVMLYSSVSEIQKESKSSIFDDGIFQKGRIYLLTPSSIDDVKRYDRACLRVAARAVLADVPRCPAWYAEALSLQFSNDLTRFGLPARHNTASFSDLSEEYARSESLKDQREVFAKLASTAHFLVKTYGEEAVRASLGRFDPGATIEEVFERSFGQKCELIERAWVKALGEPYGD